ncbi:SPOSA6832_02433 [Sporobolomyces salmonicolor]|uniref:DNA-directed RNA polymerase III subunit RPC3 n=1 Tax=Sporidiobolus salmonicolor TaxID=5005 RepID=A0A0D6ELK5_SPOSA|nr:SPOSA6832_02433 [Sporobolomyces salmonicolor]
MSSVVSSIERTRLLEHLVYQQFGNAVGEVAGILLSRGALSFPQLLRLTALAPPIVHNALLVLSVHSLLYHSDTEVNGRITELYELNHDAVERRLRGGRYAEMAEEWEGGPELSEAIEWLWREGMLRKEDLHEVVKQRILTRATEVTPEELLDPKGKKRARITTDDEGPSSRFWRSPARVLTRDRMPAAQHAAEMLVRRAFAQGYISVVTPGSQLSPSSLEIKWEEELRLTIKGQAGAASASGPPIETHPSRSTGIPTSKDLANVKKLLREKQEEWAEEERARAKGKVCRRLRSPRFALTILTLHSASQGGDAAEQSDDEPKRKKRRKRKGQPESSDEEEIELRKVDPPLPDEVFFRINEERFHIRWRAKLLTSFARDLYNPHVAAVLGVILDIVSNETELMSEAQSRAVSLNELGVAYEKLPPSRKLDLSAAFAHNKKDRSWPPPRGRTIDYILAICEVLSGQDQWGMSSREMFLLQVGEAQHAKWSVNFAILGKAMKRALVEAIVKEKLGQEALRCWRIMEAKGKLDEKHLARLAFLSVKDARETLGRLSDASLIEPQEVPRSADRAPSRTIYLWFVDFNKVVTALVGHHYKALANVQAQRVRQLDLHRGLIEKRERSDVRADPSLLSKRDREGIAALDQTLEALAVAEMRIDEQLFVLREFDPDPTEV